MSKKNRKQFGVWMDGHQATVVGRADPQSDAFSVLGVAGDARDNSVNERNESRDPKTQQHRFFKEILLMMQNAEEVHLTGTGTAQEQMMKFMAAMPQFRNTVTMESTSNKMSDENLVIFITAKFNPILDKTLLENSKN
jgi:hypothetical protein